MELSDKQTNLRDFKKEKTANKLANAAFELALERGLDGFVVKDIVQRAGYSRRTFANYYSCKEEAVVAVVLNPKEAPNVHELISEIENATPIDILYHVMKMQFTADLLRKVHQLVALSRKYPTLDPYILSVLQHFQIEAVKAVSSFSDGRYPEEYPYLLAGAVYGAVFPLVDGSINVQFPGQSTAESSGTMTFEQYLDTTFNYLRNGF
ncbi:MAG TPA: TetR/AcrR family transcriptional regulator [Candidatus Avamphibacillus sp.]|nr:TetR/AcrR family transcriptional regulator [Candidatus Avamphibacillus sp.]